LDARFLAMRCSAEAAQQEHVVAAPYTPGVGRFAAESCAPRAVEAALT